MPTVTAPPYFFPDWDAGRVPTTSLSFGTGPETICLSLPALTPDALDAVSQHLLAAQAQHLACRPIAEIVDVIDRVIQLWLDPQYPYRQQAEAFLPIITRYSAPMVRHGLDTLLQALVGLPQGLLALPHLPGHLLEGPGQLPQLVLA